MSPEMAGSHEAVTGLITRVWDEPVFLQPDHTSSLARELPKTPLCSHSCDLQSPPETQAARGFWVWGGGGCLLACGGTAALNTQACITVCHEKNPQQLVLVAASLWTFILGWTMKTIKPCKNKWLRKTHWVERVFLMWTPKYLETSCDRKLRESSQWAGYHFLPSLFISFSSNGSSSRNRQSCFIPVQSTIRPTYKRQSRRQIDALPLLSLQRCASPCSMEYNSPVSSQIYFAC